MTGRTLEVADIAESIREYLSQERCDDGPVVFPCVIRMMPGAAETLLKFIENAQEQREELKAAETMLEGVLDTIAGIMTGYELQTEESIAWLEWHKMWKASKPARTA